MNDNAKIVTTNIMYESKGTKNPKHIFLSIFEFFSTRVMCMFVYEY